LIRWRALPSTDNRKIPLSFVWGEKTLDPVVATGITVSPQVRSKENRMRQKMLREPHVGDNANKPRFFSDHDQDGALGEREDEQTASKGAKMGTVAAVIAFPFVFSGFCDGGRLAFGSVTAAIRAAGVLATGVGSLAVLLVGAALKLLFCARRQRRACVIRHDVVRS
jgi:hypothetical protein